MQLEPIDPASIDAACRWLERGFGNPVDFWRRTIDRANTVKRAAEWPVGYFFRESGREVGVVIIFHSRRHIRDGQSQVVANTSSLYLEPAYDSLGSLRFARLVMQSQFPMNDLFPDSHFVPILTKLGFQLWSDGFVLSSWPTALLSSNGGSAVVSMREVPVHGLSDLEFELLEDHERLGFISAALDTGDGWRPLVFARRSAKRLPCGYLIHADSPELAWRHRRAITSFLMKRGMPLLAFDCREQEKPEGAAFFARDTKRYYRGDFFKGRIDLAYSDFVYSDVKARRNGIR